jgi:hypothetical protein
MLISPYFHELSSISGSCHRIEVIITILRGRERGRGRGRGRGRERGRRACIQQSAARCCYEANVEGSGVEERGGEGDREMWIRVEGRGVEWIRVEERRVGWSGGEWGKIKGGDREERGRQAGRDRMEGRSVRVEVQN